MDRHDTPVGELNGDVVHAFLEDHVNQYGHLPTASVMPLLDYLRAEDVIPSEPARRRSPLHGFVDEYRDWLAVERALSPDTVRGYTRLASRFLEERVSAGNELGVEGVTGADVTAFLLHEFARVRPGSLCCHANQLRQLLRFLGLRGFADPGLADAVPSVGRWRDAGIPRFPARPAIGRMLGSCDHSRRVGVRDFAILTLLARLGLRTVEVARLERDDLHWRTGERSMAGVTSAPAYVVERCRRSAGRIRDSAQPPREPPRVPERACADATDRAARGEICRQRRVPPAGIEHVAARRLRHALASRLLREGASLIDISQVLRHKHLESTAIYAKVDLARLRQAAGSWPGAAR
jgi:site-specific recombinase XerD